MNYSAATLVLKLKNNERDARGHPFSTYGKFYEKLTYLTP